MRRVLLARNQRLAAERPRDQRIVFSSASPTEAWQAQQQQNRSPDWRDFKANPSRAEPPLPDLHWTISGTTPGQLHHKSLNPLPWLLDLWCAHHSCGAVAESHRASRTFLCSSVKKWAHRFRPQQRNNSEQALSVRPAPRNFTHALRSSRFNSPAAPQMPSPPASPPPAPCAAASPSTAAPTPAMPAPASVPT